MQKPFSSSVPQTAPIIIPDVFRIGAFISIPKNASKTVLEVLGLGPNRDLETTNSPVIYENHQRGVILAREYDLQRLFVFCFCRNPYDRCVSWYEYHRNMEPYRHRTFKEWVRAGLPHHWTRQNKTDYIAEGISPLLQYHFISGCKVDFIGRMEQFNTDFSKVVNTLNQLARDSGLRWQFQFRDLRRNTSDRSKPLEHYYDAETRDHVYSVLQQDFDYFGYSR